MPSLVSFITILLCLLSPSIWAEVESNTFLVPEKSVKSKTVVRQQGLITKIWWNNTKKIKMLSLSDEQRAHMDAELKLFLEVRQAQQQQQRGTFQTLGRAFLAEDKEAIQRHSDKIVEIIANPIRQQIAMMGKVIAILTPEQRKKLGSEYPQMLSRLWVRSIRPRQGRIGKNRKGSLQTSVR